MPKKKNNDIIIYSARGHHSVVGGPPKFSYGQIAHEWVFTKEKLEFALLGTTLAIGGMQVHGIKSFTSKKYDFDHVYTSF